MTYVLKCNSSATAQTMRSKDVGEEEPSWGCQKGGKPEMRDPSAIQSTMIHN